MKALFQDLITNFQESKPKKVFTRDKKLWAARARETMATVK